MKYTVTWHESAQEQLARLWAERPDRSAIAAAADAIDRELTYNPERKGKAMAEGLRTLFIPPLQVLFSVSEPDRLVEVAVVRYVTPPPPRPDRNGHLPTHEGEH